MNTIKRWINQRKLYKQLKIEMESQGVITVAGRFPNEQDQRDFVLQYYLGGFKC